MLETLLKLETSLYLDETRSNEAYLSRILSPNFSYIRYDGQLFDKYNYIESKQLNFKVNFPFMDIKIKQLENDYYIIRYKILWSDNEDITGIYVTSIWSTFEDVFQLVNLQETLI